MIVAELELDVTATGAQEAQDQLLQIQNVAQDVADTAINLDINTDDIKTELTDIVDGQPVAVHVIADTDEAQDEIRDLGTVSLEDLGIAVDADTAPARAALQNLQSEKIEIDADTQPASRALADVQKDISRLSNARGMIHLDTQSLALAQRDVQKMVDSGQDMREATADWATAFVQAGRESEDSLGDLEAYYRQVYRELQQGIDVQVDTHEVETAGRQLEEIPRSTKKMGDAASQNFKEMAGNFNGNISQMGDAAQQFVSESLMGFGPAGMVAGIAAAAGIGLIRGALDDAKEKAKETAENVADVADGLLGLKDGDDPTDLVRERLHRFATTSGDDGKTIAQNYRDMATNVGINSDDFQRAMAGDAESAKRSMSEIAQARDLAAARQESYGEAFSPFNRNLKDLDDMREKIVEVSGEQISGADSAEIYADAVAGIGDASGDTTDRLKEQLGAMQDLQGITLDASDAAISYQEALESAAEAVVKNGAGLDLTTEAGRENQRALDDIAKSGLDVVESMQAQGAATPELQAKMGEVRQAFLDAAGAAGVGADEANGMADKLQLIPGDVKIDITADSSEAEAAAARTKAAYNGLPTEIHTGIWVDVGNWWSDLWRTFTGMPIQQHADGGPITGPGGPTDDSVIIAASAGEHMIPADEVKMAGGQAGVFALRSALRAGTLSYPGGPTTATTASASTAVVGPSALAGALDGVRMTLDVDGREIDGVIRATARDEALDVAQMGAM